MPPLSPLCPSMPLPRARGRGEEEESGCPELQPPFPCQHVDALNRTCATALAQIEEAEGRVKNEERRRGIKA